MAKASKKSSSSMAKKEGPQGTAVGSGSRPGKGSKHPIPTSAPSDPSTQGRYPKGKALK